MGFIVALAVRNLARNVRRTAISSLAIVAGVVVVILGQGFVEGIDENVLRGYVDTQTGHVLLQPPNYPTDGLSSPVDVLVAEPAAMASALQGLAVARRLRVDTQLVHGPDALRARLVGYDPATDEAVFPRDRFTLEGAWGDAPGKEGVVLGVGLARLLNLKVGDQVMATARTTEGARNALSWTVVGVLTTNNPALDNFVAFAPYEVVDALVQAPGPSEVAVRLPRRALADGEAERLAQATGWRATTYRQAAADLLALNAIRKAALTVMVVLLMIIAAVGIANTVIMAVYERVREIGTLKSMGMDPDGITRLFVFEGAIMGLGSALLGAVLGAALNWWFSWRGIDFSGTPDAQGQVPIDTTLYSSFGWDMVLTAMAFGVIVATVAAFGPARVAAGLNPADAVRAD